MITNNPNESNDDNSNKIVKSSKLRIPVTFRVASAQVTDNRHREIIDRLSTNESSQNPDEIKKIAIEIVKQRLQNYNTVPNGLTIRSRRTANQGETQYRIRKMLLKMRL